LLRCSSPVGSSSSSITDGLISGQAQKACPYFFPLRFVLEQLSGYANGTRQATDL